MLGTNVDLFTDVNLTITLKKGSQMSPYIL